jgi:hypothetical protein
MTKIIRQYLIFITYLKILLWIFFDAVLSGIGIPCSGLRASLRFCHIRPTRMFSMVYQSRET